MVRSIAFALGLLGTLSFAPGGAFAQIDPSDAGLGTKLGMQQENNSGQVGTVTLFRRGNRTLVDVRVVDEPQGRREPAHIHRGKECDSLDPKPAFGLAPVVNGHSRTLVEYPESRLLSGNYVVNVHSASNPAVYVSCGQLYR